jgi:hypothetical protein
MLEQYDPPTISTDLPGEVAAALLSPVEIAQFFSNVVEPGGLTIPSPTWWLEDLMPLIETEWTTVVNYGSTYDYKPDSLSKFLYGTHDLWPLLLTLNNAETRADFVGPTFTVVRTTALFNLVAAMQLAQQRAAAAFGGVAPNYGDLTIRQIPTF